MEHYKFFQNRTCEFFPCHRGIGEAEFNCLFCYCPLYALGDRCGGHFCYTEDGVKDCSGCLRPHIRGNYDSMVKEINHILELAKKKERA